MKRNAVIIIASTIVILFGMKIDSKAKEPFVEPMEMSATAYCDNGITASVEYVRLGICAAKREWIGKTAIVYSQEDGVPTGVIGIYEIKDTGGHKLIKAGKCVDIYMERYDQCKQFGRKKVLVQIIDAKG